MKVLLIIMALIIILCLVLINVAVVIDSHTLEQYADIGLLISIIGFAVIAITIAIDTPNYEPTALDVYRGKTTFEITYRDSVAIDSTVVYKVK